MDAAFQASAQPASRPLVRRSAEAPPELGDSPLNPRLFERRHETGRVSASLEAAENVAARLDFGAHDRLRVDAVVANTANVGNGAVSKYGKLARLAPKAASGNVRGYDRLHDRSGAASAKSSRRDKLIARSY